MIFPVGFNVPVRIKSQPTRRQDLINWWIFFINEPTVWDRSKREKDWAAVGHSWRASHGPDRGYVWLAR